MKSMRFPISAQLNPAIYYDLRGMAANTAPPFAGLKIRLTISSSKIVEQGEDVKSSFSDHRKTSNK